MSRKRGSRRHLLAWSVAVLLAAGCAGSPGGIPYHQTAGSEGAGPRILCVVAHPDDEIAFAGTIYKAATFLDAVCDLVTITNGEGGYKYSTLAEPVYGLELTREDIGRSQLPAIRTNELLESARILHFRRVYQLNERDHQYTRDVHEVLGDDRHVWDLPHVAERLDRILTDGNYDFVFTLPPVEETHGHHKAATTLALEAVMRMSPEKRPVVLAVMSSGADRPEPSAPTGLKESAITTMKEEVGPFVFDRNEAIGYQGRLNYNVIVNWAIAAHKSQGTMQLLMNRGQQENYFLFGLNPEDAAKKTAMLFESLRGKQFKDRAYAD